MRKIRGWVVAALLIALLIIVKFVFFPKKDETASAAKGKQAPGAQVVPVNYFVVDTSTFNNQLFAAGRVGALNQVELAPETGGRVVAVRFKEGENVAAGTLLVELNNADLQAQLVKIRTQLKLSEEKLERLRKLLQVEGVSRQEYDMQENEVASLKADEGFVQAQIAKTRIVAPFSGVVGFRNISEGAYVSPSTPVLSLVQVKPVYIEFSVPEKYSSLFRPGLSINFGTEAAAPGETYTANIYAIEPRIDESTKSIKARAMYNGKASLLPGAFVRVFVNLERVKNAIMIPTQCVVPMSGGQKVVLVKDGAATEATVSIGVRGDKAIEITSGLKVGDTLVASGLLAVKNGSKVKMLQPVK